MNPKLSITMDAMQWQIVVNLLAEGPYRIAAPIIIDMQAQFAQQQQPAPQFAPPMQVNPEALANGEAHSDGAGLVN
jgi:hypothetical protein